MPLAFLGLPLYVYIPNAYAELPSIGVTLAGLVIFGARLVDLVTDPLVGQLTDRLRGYVHPRWFIAVGSAIVALAVSQLFFPDQQTTALSLAVAISLCYLGVTLVQIPYMAWGVELAPTLNKQRFLSLLREGSAVLGVLGALILIAVSESSVLHSLGITLLLLLPISILPLWLVSDGNKRQLSKPSSDFFLTLFKKLPVNNQLMLKIYFANSLAAGIPATLFLFYANDVLGLSDSEAGPFLFIYFFSALLSLPVWLKLLKVFDEIKVWMSSMVLAALAFIPAVFLSDSSYLMFYLVCVLTGFTLGIDTAIPAVLQARFAQRQFEIQGTTNAGTSFGVFGLVSKLALAFALAVSFVLLGFSDTSFPRHESLPVLYAVLPALIKLVAAYLLFKAAPILRHASDRQQSSKPPAVGGLHA